jgi:hypothetical protein
MMLFDPRWVQVSKQGIMKQERGPEKKKQASLGSANVEGKRE